MSNLEKEKKKLEKEVKVLKYQQESNLRDYSKRYFDLESKYKDLDSKVKNKELEISLYLGAEKEKIEELIRQHEIKVKEADNLINDSATINSSAMDYDKRVKRDRNLFEDFRISQEKLLKKRNIVVSETLDKLEEEKFEVQAIKDKLSGRSDDLSIQESRLLTFKNSLSKESDSLEGLVDEQNKLLGIIETRLGEEKALLIRVKEIRASNYDVLIETRDANSLIKKTKEECLILKEENQKKLGKIEYDYEEIREIKKELEKKQQEAEQLYLKWKNKRRE